MKKAAYIMIIYMHQIIIHNIYISELAFIFFGIMPEEDSLYFAMMSKLIVHASHTRSRPKCLWMPLCFQLEEVLNLG